MAVPSWLVGRDLAVVHVFSRHSDRSLRRSCLRGARTPAGAPWQVEATIADEAFADVCASLVRVKAAVGLVPARRLLGPAANLFYERIGVAQS